MLKGIYMKSYKEFEATMSDEQRTASKKLLEEACPELNDFPPIVTASRDPNDAKHVRKVKIPFSLFALKEWFVIKFLMGG